MERLILYLDLWHLPGGERVLVAVANCGWDRAKVIAAGDSALHDAAVDTVEQLRWDLVRPGARVRIVVDLSSEWRWLDTSTDEEWDRVERWPRTSWERRITERAVVLYREATRARHGREQC